MLIYFILYFVLIFSGILDLCNIPASKKRFLLFFWVVVLTLFRGLRWETGTDWYMYLDIFERIQWSELFSFIRYGEQKLEFGYAFLNLVVKSFGGGYTTFLIFTNAIILLIYADFSCKHSQRFPLLLFIAIITANNFFPVRQSLTVAIVMYSYRYVINRDFVKFIVSILIAISIHSASLIFLPFYFLLRIKVPSLLLYVIMLSSLFVGEYLFKVMGYVINGLSFLGSHFTRRLEIYATMAEGMFDKTERSLFNVFVNFVFLSLFLVVRKNRHGNYQLNVFLNSFVIGLAITNMFYTYMQELVRFASYFTIASAVIYPYLMEYFKQRYKLTLSLIFFFVLALLMMHRFLRLLDFYPDNHFPYKSVISFL